VVFRRDRVLLVERGREPLKGYWSLPGGVLEVGETLESAAARETREETGLEVVPLSVIEVFERLILDERGRPEYHYVLIDFLCRARGGTPTPGGDVVKAEWVPRRDLLRYRLTEGAAEVIEKAWKRHQELRKP
jgi:ADP-ribose pyrophosphatase YjhB (NUDIX family)